MDPTSEGRKNRNDSRPDLLLGCQKFFLKHHRNGALPDLLQNLACQESPHHLFVKMLFQGVDNLEDLRISVPPDKFG